MKIFSVPDVERFFNLVKKSRGDITLHLPDGNQVNLKQSYDAQALFQLIHPGQSGLDIHLSNSADTMGFIQYMMEACISH